MHTSTSLRWLVVAVSAAMLLMVAAACAGETVEVPGQTVVVEKEVIKTVEVPGETVVKEVVKEVMVPGETVVVKEEVVKEVMVPGETVVVEKEVVKTIEVPGQTVTVEVVKEVQVPGETVVVEKEVVKTVEVPGETVVVEKVVVKEVAGKKYVTDPVTGKVFSAPEYGGTITFAKQNDYNQRGVDLYSGGNVGMTTPVTEKLSTLNWALDRNLYPFSGGYMTPVFALTGALAESWEQPDDTTYVFNIRPGVQWHNKAPVNGRELTASDVEFTYHRILGNKLTGTAFSEADPSPGGGNLIALPWESVEATDDHTIVMKMKEPPPFSALKFILDYWSVGVQPPEVIREHGGIKDWRNLVGTGPYEMTEWVIGENFTYTKNPNYWGHDPKYPENRLPYVDEGKGFVIVEHATRLAGLRSGKLDYIGLPGSTQIFGIDQALSLQRTNPEILQYPWSNRSDNSAQLNTTKPPFNDIKVRRAMQMALDLDTMNESYFSGYADTIPRGLIGRVFADYITPFEEWPEELQGYYTYDPEGAEALLDEAGYERDGNGIRFKTTFLHFNRFPVAWSEFMVAYWAAIGIDINHETPAAAEFGARSRAHDYDIISSSAGLKADPLWQMNQYYSGYANRRPVDDAQYDALYEAAIAVTTLEEMQELINKMDDRIIEQSWLIWGSLSPQFNVAQPWVLGYDGEGILGGSTNHVVFQYLWIDSELKNRMGY